jgi:hypothetical protein
MPCESCRRRPAVFWASFGRSKELRTAPRFVLCADCLAAIQPADHDWVEIIKLSA